MHIQPPRVIMFDLDGTLIDTMFAFADLAAELMAANHGDEVGWARERYLATSGIPFAQQLEVIHPGHPANGATETEFELRKKDITRRARMDAETIAALAELRRLGAKLVLSSNTGQEFVDEFVDAEDFEFDLALGFHANSGMAKGAPHVAHTLHSFHAVPEQVWFVGDSLKDGELASATGLAFFGRLGTFDAADFERAAAGTPTLSSIADLVAHVHQALEQPRRRVAAAR